MKRDNHISHEVYFGEDTERCRPVMLIKLDETGIRISGIEPNEETGDIEFCLDKEEINILIRVLEDYVRD